MRKVIAAIFVTALFAGACGGVEDTPAAFEDVEVNECVKSPVAVGGVTVLGQRVDRISDLQVCVHGKAAAGAVPRVVSYDDCGDNCYAIWVEDLDVAADAAIQVTYTRAGQSQKVIEYDPAPVEHRPESGKTCVIGHGEPDPCTSRITQPQKLTGLAGKKKVSLTWSKAVHTDGKPVVGYEVWRSLDGQTFEVVGTVTEPTFSNTGLTRVTSYWYYVVAFDADGTYSAASKVVTLKTR